MDISKPTVWYRRPALLITATLLLLAFFPVRLSVLASAELVPLRPAIIRAPLDGVIDRVDVEPNQRVKRDEPLFSFDQIALANRLSVARQSLATAQTAYRQAAQKALYDPDSKALLGVTQSRVNEQQAEVEYLRQLNARSQVTAPLDGLALFADATELIGKPVMTGERVMMIANENQSEVEAWIVPADMIHLTSEAPIKVYLAADPLTPVSARIRYIAHQAELQPEGHYAYRVRATLESEANTVPRVGLKGTAKLYGDRAPLIYWIMRRPWATLRGWIGW